MKKSNNTRNKITAPRVEKGETTRLVFRTLFLCILSGVSVVAIIFGLWVRNVLAETPDLNTSSIFANVSTFIYDEDGVLLIELGTERREWVQFHEISPVMIDAILAIEDARFFDHYGVDWSRTIVAVMYTAQNLATGVDSMQGGSTLTQQLINQTHLLMETGERDTTIERKLQEIMLAIQLEREFSKEQIIEAYLNFAPFGGRIFGVQAAAEFYFGVDASQLTLSQAATLAGLVQLPNVHRPDWNAIQTQIRRNEVLDLMVRHGFITPELRDLAAAEPVTDLLVYSEITRSDVERYQPFIDRVLNEAHERFGIDPMGGYRIHTTLNRDAQGFVFDLLMTNDHFAWPNQAMQTGIAMVGNDGRIRAIAGRELLRTSNYERGFNLAVDGRRQPGSVSKPIWAYGPAVEYLRWGTGTMINDELFAYGGGADPLGPGPLVRNFDNRYRGRVSLRNAMDHSWNIPAIKAMNAVTREFEYDTVVDFVESLGIPPYPEGLFESHAIGSHPVSPLQIASAYSAFAAGGIFTEPFTIERIIAPNGDILYETPHSDRVMSEATAYMITSTLRSTMTQGSGRPAQVDGQWLAGKTGTTNFSDEIRQRWTLPFGAVPDVWFAGYSMDYTVAIWTGYHSINDGTFLHGTDRDIPRRLFQIIMRELNTAGMRAPERPSSVVSHSVEWHSGSEDGEVCFPSAATPGSFIYSELFHADAVPTCTSTVFSGSVSAPDAPENFAVSAGGGMTLNFTWEHSDIGASNATLSLAEATEALNRARSLTVGQTRITDALRNLDPGEAEAQMMINRINAGARGGELNYAVIGVFANGTTRELVSTELNSVTHTLSISEAATIQSFHVIASTSGGSSGPSNSVLNNGFVEMPDTIPVPNMAGLGWTRNQAKTWGETYGVPVVFDEEYSDTVPEHLVTRTNPTDSVILGQTLRVFISQGPEPYLPNIPGLPQPPNPDDDLGDEPVDGPGDSDDTDNLDPFNISPGLEDVINVGNTSYNQNWRSSRMLAAVLERFKGVVS